jgi:hypothetical protein
MATDRTKRGASPSYQAAQTVGAGLRTMMGKGAPTGPKRLTAQGSMGSKVGRTLRAALGRFK